MTTRLLDGGHPVAVFDRTVSKTDSLVERGARPAASAETCLVASDLSFVMLSDAEACRAVLADGHEPLDHRLFVNPSTVAPEQSREGERDDRSVGRGLTRPDRRHGPRGRPGPSRARPGPCRSKLPEVRTRFQIPWSGALGGVTVGQNVPPDVLGVFVSAHAAVRAVADDTG